MTLGPDPRTWPEAERVWWEELAAQIEFDGAGCSRGAAEAMAARLVRERVSREASADARRCPP